MPADQIGYPKVCKSFTGVDQIGVDTSIDNTLSIWNRSPKNSRPGSIVIGSNVTVMPNVRMVLTSIEEEPLSGISIADNVIVNYGAFLSGEGGLFIGRNVLIGPYAMFLSGGHDIDSDQEIYYAPLKNKPILLEEECWIGAQAKILGGVRIGQGAVVGAGALVTKDVPPYCVVVGIPAKIIKFRSKGNYSFLRKLAHIFFYNSSFARLLRGSKKSYSQGL